MAAIFSIPENDEKTLAQFYEEGQQVEGLTTERFIDNIAWRIYTEFCCNRAESPVWKDHLAYNGEAYRKWVDDEIQYAFERQKQQNLPVGEGDSQQAYARMRERILGGVVKRAVELFTAWKGATYPPREMNDARNLRASLEPYL